MWLNPFMDGCQCGYITKLKKKMIGCTVHIESFPMVLTISFFKCFVVAIQI
jgi:hypothetical protein